MIGNSFEQLADQYCNIASQYCNIARKRTSGWALNNAKIYFTCPTAGTYEYKSFTTIHPKSAQAQAAASQIPDKQKGKPLYVGNFTWVSRITLS